MEWVARVTVASIALDDPLPLLLDNPRACVPQPGTPVRLDALKIVAGPR